MTAVRHYTVPYYDRDAEDVPGQPMARWWWGCSCGDPAAVRPYPSAGGPFATEAEARVEGKAHERDAAREDAEHAEWLAEIDALVTLAEAELREDDRRYLTGIGDAIAAAYEPLLDHAEVRRAALEVDPEVLERRMDEALAELTQPSGPCKPRVCRPRRATR